MCARTPAALLLGLLLASAAYTQTPGALQPKDPAKTDPKSDPKQPDPKDMGKGTMTAEFKWPESIDRRNIHEWLKDATENPDPAIRESALKVLPAFGPRAQKECAAKLLKRMAPPSDRG